MILNINKYLSMSKDSTTVRTVTASKNPTPFTSWATQNAQPLPHRLATTVNKKHVWVSAVKTWPTPGEDPVRWPVSPSTSSSLRLLRPTAPPSLTHKPLSATPRLTGCLVYGSG